MKPQIHRIAAITATLCIATFFTATLLVEFFGSAEAIARLKHFIVVPGLFILIPAMAATGGSGFSLARHRGDRLVSVKKQRMRLIGANGVLILVPAAIILDRWAAAGSLDTRFYALQGVELLAGMTNLTLMGLNLRDGLRLRSS